MGLFIVSAIVAIELVSMIRLLRSEVPQEVKSRFILSMGAMGLCFAEINLVMTIQIEQVYQYLNMFLSVIVIGLIVKFMIPQDIYRMKNTIIVDGIFFFVSLGYVLTILVMAFIV